MEASAGKAFKDQVKEFPSSFNLVCAETITWTKLKAAKHNLSVELDNNDDCESEIIRKKNLLSWIYFRLERQDDSVELSNEIVKLTQLNNIASLGNRCFIMWDTGDELEATRCLDRLKKMTNENNFDTLLTEARAEQAYYYSRLGGSENLSLAISLFSESVAKMPSNYLWKYGLGLVYRRATHPNIFCSSPKRLDVDKLTKTAIENFFYVADNGDSRLKSMAYAELAYIRHGHKVGRSFEYDNLFRKLKVEDFVEKALETGGDVPSVLTRCGKVLRWIDVDKSILLLEKSVEIKSSSHSYHFLGKSYKRKATPQRNTNRLSISAEEAEAVEQFQQSTERSGPTGNSKCASEGMQEPTESSYCFPRGVSGTRRQLFHQPLRDHKYMPTDRRWADEHTSPSVFNKYTTKQSYQSKGMGWTSEQRSFDGFSFLRQPYRHPSVRSPSGQYDQPFEGFNNLGQPYGHPSVRSPSGQYDHDQTLPYGHQKECGRWKCRGRGRIKRGETNFVRSLSTPSFTHEINRCDQRKGHSSRLRGNARGQRISASEHGLRTYARRSSNLYLDKEDECVKKAESCFKKAIELSKENFPAILDLGILLKETGEIQEALKQFNKVTNSPLSSNNSKVTVISACEEAGLCYLKMSEADSSDSGYEEEGKKKLTQAVSLAADLALTMPELQDCAQSLWTAFQTLMNKIDSNVSSPHQRKEKFKLLEIAKKHGTIIDVLQKMLPFTGNELDKEIVVVAIKSYLKLNQPKNALALQNMIAIRPDVGESTWWNTDPVLELRINVLLHAISGRLEGTNGNPTMLFQQVFEISFGTRFWAVEEHHNPEGDVVGDVLIVFDDDEEGNESPGSTVASSLCLMTVATSLFGLKAEKNLKRSGNYFGLVHDLQLEEMRKYPVVIIVLGSETRAPIFDGMLQCVTHNKRTQEPKEQRILVIDSGLKDGVVPTCLAHYECFKLNDIGGLGNIGQSSEFENNEDQISFVDILTRGFHGNSQSILKLFCFVIGKNWQDP